MYHISGSALQRRQNGRDGVSNHQPHDCLFNRLFRHRSKKTSKLRVTGLCEWNSPVTGEFPAQRSSNAENVPIWCRHHANIFSGTHTFSLHVTTDHIYTMSNMLHPPAVVDSFYCYDDRITEFEIYNTYNISVAYILDHKLILGPYSLSVRTSYRMISGSLEAVRFGFRLFQSLWNLTGASAIALPKCLSNKVWWLCLVPTSTTRFASDVGYRMAKIKHSCTRKIFFMNNDI